MSILKNRKQNDDILKGRFIRKVLQTAATDIDKAQRKYMTSRGFTGDWDRSFNVTDNQLDHEHLKKQRFVDMRTRTVDGKKKLKKSHPIHNRIIFGNYNNIVRELAYGFTQEVKQQMRELENP